MNRRVAVRAMVVHEGKLLCVRLKPYGGVSALMASNWCLPGGGLDSKEPLVQGLEREMFEETGVKAVVGNLVYTQQFTYKEQDCLEFFFRVTNSEDYLDIDLSKTTHGANEIAEIGFIDPAKTDLLPKFLMTEPVIEKVLSNTPPDIFSYQR